VDIVEGENEGAYGRAHDGEERDRGMEKVIILANIEVQGEVSIEFRRPDYYRRMKRIRAPPNQEERSQRRGGSIGFV
jgi:hypothetical protein